MVYIENWGFMLAKFLGEYSNGWGHVIVTVALLVSFTILLALHVIEISIFTAVISPLILFWFGTGIANTALRTREKMEKNNES